MRCDSRSADPADGRAASPADEPRTDGPIARTQLLLPLGARLPARMGLGSGDAQCRRAGGGESRAGTEGHSPARIRSRDHRSARREANPSGMGCARRREPGAHSDRPGLDGRASARGHVDHSGDARPVQVDVRRDEGPRRSDRVLQHVHGTRPPGRRVGALLGRPPARRLEGQGRRRWLRPVALLRDHPGSVGTMDLSQVPALRPEGVPRRHVSRRPAWPRECLRSLRDAARAGRARGVPGWREGPLGSRV